MTSGCSPDFLFLSLPTFYFSLFLSCPFSFPFPFSISLSLLLFLTFPHTHTTFFLFEWQPSLSQSCDLRSNVLILVVVVAVFISWQLLWSCQCDVIGRLIYDTHIIMASWYHVVFRMPRQSCGSKNTHTHMQTSYLLSLSVHIHMPICIWADTTWIKFT